MILIFLYLLVGLSAPAPDLLSVRATESRQRMADLTQNDRPISTNLTGKSQAK